MIWDPRCMVLVASFNCQDSNPSFIIWLPTVLIPLTKTMGSWLVSELPDTLTKNENCNSAK